MGKGFNAYGHYRLTYDKTSKWDSNWDVPDYPDYHSYNVDGHEWKHEGLVGAAFQLGAGRMGVFLEYTGINGKYKGDENELHMGDAYYYTIDMKDRLNNYSLRAIYGLPVGAVNVGAEVQLAYRGEQKKTVLDYYYSGEPGYLIINYLWAADAGTDMWPLLYNYMIPYKSKYWEAQGKLSVAGLIGAAKYALTLKGGLPFASDNKYFYFYYYSGHTAEMDGKVKGFNIGGDFWVRVPVNAKVVLPFVIGAEYGTIKRDGAGIDSYDHETKNLAIRVGGGVDFTPAKGTKLAAGLYYDYLSIKEDTWNDYYDYYDIGENNYSLYMYSDMPQRSEHRLTLRLLGEKELSPAVALRGGFNAFYGLVRSDYAFSTYYNEDDGDISYDAPLDLSTKGYNWGLGASIGATVKVGKISLEPFLNGGYIQYKIDGDTIIDGWLLKTKFEKTNWLVGGGLSVKF